MARNVRLVFVVFSVERANTRTRALGKREATASAPVTPLRQASTIRYVHIACRVLRLVRRSQDSLQHSKSDVSVLRILVHIAWHVFSSAMYEVRW